MKNLYSRFRNYFRHKILFNMPFALRLHLSIAGLLITAFIIVFILTSEILLPIVRNQIEVQALNVIGNIQSELLVNVKKAISAGRILNNYAAEDLNDTDKAINLERMAFTSANVFNTIDPDNKLFHASFIYVAPQDGRTESMHQFFIGKDGKIRIDTTTDVEIYRKREWLIKTMNLAKPVWTEPYEADDEEERPQLISFTYPIPFDAAKRGIAPQGILGIALNLENVQNLFRSITFSKDGIAFLVSKNGLYIYHPDPQVQMKKDIYELSLNPGLAPLRQVAEDFEKGKSGKVKMTIAGKSVLTFYSVQPDTGWGISLTFSQDEFFNEINRTKYKILAISFFSLIFLLFLVNILCKQLAKSIEKLAEIAQEYGNGNFEAKFPNIYGKDEIGRLADAFRNMRDNIVKYISQEKQNYAFQQKISNEMNIAGQIQSSSLETVFPEESRFSVYASMNPTKEVGGDFYDCFYLSPSKYAILIADVSGKGIPAALFMMMNKALLKMVAQSGLSLSETFNKVNNAICAKNKMELFVTAFMAVIDLETGEMEYVNAGHNPPLIRSDNGYEYFKPKKNLAIGFMQDYEYKSDKIHLNPGEKIFLYTDGITEAQDSEGHFYGTENLKNALNGIPKDCEPMQTLNMIEKKLKEFTENAPQADDITMLELSYNGDSKAAELKNKSNSNYEKRNFVARIESWDSISDFIEEKANTAGIPQPKIMKVLISAEEIFSNISRYAYDEPGNADITIYVADGMFNVLFEDTGIPYNPLEKGDPDITLSAEERQIGGLGIFIVKKTMDKAEYERKDGKNTFEIGIRIN